MSDLTSNDTIIAEILEREGGFVHVDSDRGQATKFGVTQATLSDWRKQPVTEEDVKNLSLTEARDIYREKYIEEPGFSLIECVPLRAVLVDYGVNSGPVTATKALQRVLDLTEDGILGVQTLHLANTKDGVATAVHVLAERIRHYGMILTHDASQSRFASGWLNRVADQLEVVV